MLTKTPPKEQLLPYVQNIKKGAEKFNKSARTIRRWLQYYDLYSPQEKYRPGKVTEEMAAKTRRLDRKGWTQMEIAKIIGISQPMVGRIINKGLKLGGTVTITIQEKPN